MKYILDMVHHNPGEPPFETAFLNPTHLADYGFNGQVFKHINCVATFAATGIDFFPAGSAARQWLEEFTPGIEREIAAAKARGLSVFYHVDLFVLPKAVVEHYREEICDPETGRILLDRPRTLELHRVLFDELTARFPEVDGYIVRVGETYLFDTPHHAGNGPIPKIGPGWTPDYLYEEILTGRDPGPRWTSAQVEAYVTLVDFLRSEICVKHGRQLFFRTWDIFPDKLHACREHYLDVTNRIEPHPKLAFSIKHTALDFWRRVKVNECLRAGNHPQIIEVQCQREYEGKGAYPNYVMHGVFDGFEENARPLGLKELLRDEQCVGVYSWSRGGGWYGPYIANEIWPDLNAYVLARCVQSPSRPEREVFMDYARERLRLDPADAERFRELCLLSARGVLKGRYCEAFDRVLEEAVLPVAAWMRDDRLGGRDQLALVLAHLADTGQLDAALAEKAEAVGIWEQISRLSQEIHWPDPATGDFVKCSSEYGLRLFRIVEAGWRVLAAGTTGERSGTFDSAKIASAAADYDAAWAAYRELAKLPQCPSLYEGRYFSLPGADPVPGLDESVAAYSELAAR